jgi:hypothetical protein
MDDALEQPFPRPLSGHSVANPPNGLVPARTLLAGRHIQLEPLNPTIHAAELYKAGHDSDEAPRIWDYLPFEPWPNEGKVRTPSPLTGTVLERDRGFADSLVEEEGFEPLVPEKARLKGSGRLKVLPGLWYAGGPLERATFGFPCGAENPVILPSSTHTSPIVGPAPSTQSPPSCRQTTVPALNNVRRS